MRVRGERRFQPICLCRHRSGALIQHRKVVLSSQRKALGTPYALQTAPGTATAAGPMKTEPPAAGATLISPQPQATQDPSTPHPWNPSAIPAGPAPSAPAAPVDPQPSAPAAPVHPQPSLHRLFSISALDPVASPAQSNVPGNNPPQVVPVDPALTTPTQDPPTQDPSGQTSPGQTSPGQNLPGQNPPGQNPPGQNPPGQNLPGQNPPGQNPPAPILTLLNTPLTPNSNSVYLIATQTLRAGGPAITIAGTPISLAPSAMALHIAGTASPIMPALVHPMLVLSNSAVPSNPYRDRMGLWVGRGRKRRRRRGWAKLS